MPLSAARTATGALTAAAQAGRRCSATRTAPAATAAPASSQQRRHAAGRRRHAQGQQRQAPERHAARHRRADAARRGGTAPYLHDGSAATLAAAISAHRGVSSGRHRPRTTWRPTWARSAARRPPVRPRCLAPAPAAPARTAPAPCPAARSQPCTSPTWRRLRRGGGAGGQCRADRGRAVRRRRPGAALKPGSVVVTSATVDPRCRRSGKPRLAERACT
jgi:hypothetical protein